MTDALASADATLRPVGSRTVARPPRAMFGRYLVIDSLGRGAMGEVYVAYDPELDRKVALKRVRVEDREHGERRERLLREARAMAKIRHPNVVAVFDVGQIDDEVFIAMELVDGETLRAWMGREHPTDVIVAAFVQAARGLAAAHESELVHRDFKPDNAMIDRSGRVQVLDFGLAASRARAHPPVIGEAQDAVTSDDALVGTPAYLAPEQWAGRSADAASDQFALCVALFEALYGRRPFVGDSLPALARAVCQGVITEPGSTRDSPRWLDRVVRRGLASRPEERWPSVRALLDALEHGLETGRRGRRRGWAAGVLGVGALLVAARVAVEDSSCADATAPVDALWNAEARTRIGQAFETSPIPLGHSAWPAVAAALDTRASAWRAAYVEACEAARDGSRAEIELADRRRVCLHAQLHALDGALEVLAIADPEVVEHAPALLDELPDASNCATPVTPPPGDATMREHVRRVAALSTALISAGKPAAAKDGLIEALAGSEIADDSAAAAELGVLLARTERELGDNAGAGAQIEQAYLAARAADSRALTLAAAHEYAAIFIDRSEHVPARQWIDRARVEARELGAARELAVLDGDEALALSQAGQFDAAIEKGNEALAQLDALGLGDSRDALDVLSNLGMFYYLQHRYDRAVAYKREVLDRLTPRLGEDHPAIAEVYADLGAIAATRGDFDLAKQHLDHAVAINARAFVEPHPRIGEALGSLVGIMIRSDPEAAIPLSERALANLIPARGENSLVVAMVLNNQSFALQAAGRHADAVATLRRSVAIKERVLAPDHPELAGAYENFAALIGGDGDAAAVRALYEKALAVRKLRGDPEPLAKTQADFAKWLAAHGELARASSADAP